MSEAEEGKRGGGKEFVKEGREKKAREKEGKGCVKGDKKILTSVKASINEVEKKKEETEEREIRRKNIIENGRGNETIKTRMEC